MKAIAVLCLCLTLVSCASFEMSAGIGYRKVPPEVSQPILGRALGAGIPPVWLDLLIKMLGTEGFEKLIAQLAPVNNRVDLGLWLEIRSPKGRAIGE